MKIPLVNEQGSNAVGKRTIGLRLEHLGKLERVSAVESKPASDGRIKTGHYFE